jgi:hypothetical protein
VLWVEDYSELTVEMLEESYAGIMERHRSFNFKRLTQGYWVEQINRIARAGGRAG